MRQRSEFNVSGFLWVYAETGGRSLLLRVARGTERPLSMPSHYKDITRAGPTQDSPQDLQDGWRDSYTGGPAGWQAGSLQRPRRNKMTHFRGLRLARGVSG